MRKALLRGCLFCVGGACPQSSLHVPFWFVGTWKCELVRIRPMDNVGTLKVLGLHGPDIYGGLMDTLEMPLFRTLYELDVY